MHDVKNENGWSWHRCCMWYWYWLSSDSKKENTVLFSAQFLWSSPPRSALLHWKGLKSRGSDVQEGSILRPWQTRHSWLWTHWRPTHFFFSQPQEKEYVSARSQCNPISQILTPCQVKPIIVESYRVNQSIFLSRKKWLLQNHCQSRRKLISYRQEGEACRIACNSQRSTFFLSL